MYAEKVMRYFLKSLCYIFKYILVSLETIYNFIVIIFYKHK